MLIDTHIKENLNQSYVTAIVAQAGYSLNYRFNDYGIDGTISELRVLPDGSTTESGFEFKIQLKATSVFEKKDDQIIYDLNMSAYNKLVQYKGFAVLVLFCLPEKPDDRIFQTEDYLELRNCCYWQRITDIQSNNTSSIRIRIPRDQVFSPESCHQIMKMVREEDKK